MGLVFVGLLLLDCSCSLVLCSSLWLPGIVASSFGLFSGHCCGVLCFGPGCVLCRC